MTDKATILSRRVVDDVLGDPTPSPGASVRVKAQLRRRLASSRRRRTFFGGALVVGLATLSAVLVTSVLPRSSTPPPVGEPVMASLGAPLGEGLIEFPSGARVSIARGSVVHLLADDDTGTTLRLTGGELLANVETRESSRAFVILADDVQVKVVGTTFVVASDAHNGVRVRGYEGQVWVSKGSEQTVVAAGDTWPRDVVALPMIEQANIAKRFELELELEPEPVEQTTASIAQAAAGTIETPVVVPQKPVADVRATITPTESVEADFAEALALERAGNDARALVVYRAVAAVKGGAQEDALFAVARLLRTRMQRMDEALSVFEDYRERFPGGRYARAVDVHILRIAVSARDWERVDVEASRFLSERSDDPRAPHFRLARIKARLNKGDCPGLAEDLRATPAALRLPGLLENCPQ